MTKHRVFIYGSCVSRDTFEHFDPDQFELVQYVARQSAISAYTRPVTMIEPPSLESHFQRRMAAGDFNSNLTTAISEVGSRTDLVLVDLTDERLGTYVLPDGSVVTRTTELINSGAEGDLPEGSHFVPFGSEQHIQYWTQGISVVGELLRQHMPHASVAVLHIPWAKTSDNGTPTAPSFGVTADAANPIFDHYIQIAAEALQATVISPQTSVITSGSDHPWGDAPFHYSTGVYDDVARQLGAGRKAPNALNSQSTPSKSAESKTRTATSRYGPDIVIAGTQRAGAEWLAGQLARVRNVEVTSNKTYSHFSNWSASLETVTDSYLAEFENKPNDNIVIDASPMCLRSNTTNVFCKRPDQTAEALAQLDHAMPEIAFILRNPIERAISAYWAHFAAGKFDLPKSMLQTAPNLGVVDFGFYRRHISRWMDALGEDQIHLFFYDDLVDDPNKFVADFARRFQIDIGEEFTPKGPPVETQKWTLPFQKRHPISDQEIAAVSALYEDDIAFVEVQTGRSLNHWRTPVGPREN